MPVGKINTQASLVVAKRTQATDAAQNQTSTSHDGTGSVVLAAVLTVSDRSQHPIHDVVLTGGDAKGRCAGGVFHRQNAYSLQESALSPTLCCAGLRVAPPIAWKPE